MTKGEINWVIMVYYYFCTNLPASSQVSPIKPAAQLQVSLATQAPFTHGGSHVTGRNSNTHDCYQEFERLLLHADMVWKDFCPTIWYTINF